MTIRDFLAALGAMALVRLSYLALVDVVLRARAYRAATTLIGRTVVVEPATNFHPAADGGSVITQRLPRGWASRSRVTPRSEAVTTPIPFRDANWIAVVRLQPVVMPVAADLAANRACTTELPVLQEAT